MTPSFLRRSTLLGAAALAVLAAAPARAATPAELAAAWPSTTVRLVVPYPAGGSVDSAARALASALSSRIGQTVIVDNRVGADGTIGMTAMARAPADGHTLAVSLRGAMTVAPAVMKLPFDPLTEFRPLHGIAQTAEVFAARPRTGMASLRDLPEATRRNGRPLSIGFVGGLPRMLAELLAQESGVELLKVPYKSLPGALQDLLGDQTDMLVGDAIGVLGEQVRAGKVVALAVTSATRWPDLPHVPTTRELGLGALAGNQWYALYGPKGLPPELAAKIGAAVAEAQKNPAFLQQLRSSGLQPFPAAADELTTTMRQDTQVWKGVAAKAKIQPE